MADARAVWGRSGLWQMVRQCGVVVACGRCSGVWGRRKIVESGEVSM